jgi:hypothetical protein
MSLKINFRRYHTYKVTSSKLSKSAIVSNILDNLE